MSWFWRRPSILARSLIRDVACADETRAGDAAPANMSTPAIAAENVLVILLPKKFGPADHLAKAVPTRLRAQHIEKTRGFRAVPISAGPAAGLDLPGAADFAEHLPSVNHNP